MKNILSTLIIWFGLIACNSSRVEKIETEEGPNLYSVPSDDYKMNEVIKTANKNRFLFDMAFKSNKYDTSTFALKIKFSTPTGADHIWATGITIENGNYFGMVHRVPEPTKKVKAGERFQLDKENITDWMYIDKGVLRGGYTIKFIRSSLTKAEQNKFDADLPFRIEE